MNLMKVDPNNLPEYMEECITEDHEECGMFIDRIDGEVAMMDDFLIYIKEAKLSVNWDRFKETYIMISKDF